MICCTCREDLDETEFYWKNKEHKTRQPYCKACKKDYNARWYVRHASEQKVRAKVNQQKLVDIILEAKSAPCHDCGVSYPSEVMDFDHIKGRKLGNVSSLARKGNLAKMLAEMQKCEVVCANCHRLRTAGRRSQVEKAAVS